MPDPAAAALLPAPREVVETPPHQAQIPAVGTSGQSPQDSAPAELPKLYLPLPVSTDRKGKGHPGIRQRLRSASELGKRAPLPMSLSYNSPRFRPHVAYYYQPFSSMDIPNWQKHSPPYSEEPQGMIRLMEIIFRTYHPRWDNIIQLLVSLFSTEEKHRVHTEARKWLQEMVPEGTVNSQRWAELATPDGRPDWDYNTEEGRARLEKYRASILQGLKRGAPQAYEHGKTYRSSPKGN